MAVYDQLPVFKQTYDLLLTILNLSAHFSRDMRYTLGQDIKREIIEVQKLIYQANANHEKDEFISKARVLMVGIKLEIRILFDTKQISMKQYAGCCEMAESISKQLASWQQYQKKNKNDKPK